MMKFSEQLLTVNKYSRPGSVIREVRAVAMHWTQAPGRTARWIRNYFESLKTGIEGRYASAHYAVDEYEVIMMVPADEVAYHVGSSQHPERYTAFACERLRADPNWYTIGIEMCHPDGSGKFHSATVTWAAATATTVCASFGLDPERDIIRHHDVTGKDCPRWWVEHEEEFVAFKGTVAKMLESRRKRSSP